MSLPHQVFIGCPISKDIRTNNDKLKKHVEDTTPLSLVLADTVGVSSSDFLLTHITSLIRESAACIFDATGSNPNVALEIGIAHTVPVNFIITLKTRKPKRRSTVAEEKHARETRSIISDLQGKNRIEYKLYDTLQAQLVDRFLNNLPYMKRWRDFEKKNKKLAPLLLPMFQDIRDSGRTTKTRLDQLLAGTGFGAYKVLNDLRSAKLVRVLRGSKGGIFYPAA